MSVNKQPVHLRLPQRSSLVRGVKDESGDPDKKLDPRTASEDPALKRGKTGERNKTG